MKPEFNLRRLRVFVEVARTGSFAGAADALSFTPSAVSQQMARLERELGTSLLERTSRGTRLTPAGETLLERATAILSELRGAEAELRALSEGETGRLRFGSFPTATATFGAAAIAAYRRRWPDVAVRLVDDEPHHNLVRLQSGDLDLAVLFQMDDRPIGVDYHGETLCADRGVDLHALFDDPYVVVLPERHRLAAEDAVDPGDLDGETMIGSVHWPGLRRFADACARAGARPDFNGYASFDYGTVRGLVAAGEGLAVVPELATRVPQPGAVTRPLRRSAPVRHVLAGIGARRASPPVAGMLGLLRELARRPAPVRRLALAGEGTARLHPR